MGVDDTRVFKSAGQNMISAKQNPQVIEEYLQAEVARGNTDWAHSLRRQHPQSI